MSRFLKISERFRIFKILRSLAAPATPAPSDDAIRLHRAEAEVERLRGVVRNQEQAPRVAGRVLSPYLNRL
jgi:hypothetical protein